MNAEPLSDAGLRDLASDAVKGDRAATARLFHALVPRVRNLVRYLVRGDREVDDMTQDALLAILKGLPGYQGTGEFRSWADRVTARSVFSRLRTRPSPPTVASEPDQLPDPDASQPECYTVRRQLVAKLDQLPSEQRAALVMHHVLGLTVGEIATEVKASEETVRSRLRLAKRRMRGTPGPGKERMVG